MTAGDVLVETLIAWGVDTVFGLPGDGINGIMEALRTRRDQIRFVQVRHEESAAFAACAYSKFTGGLGVCLATSGPGAIHLLNGLYDAKLDGAAVLAITGAPFHDLMDTRTQQDVAVDRLFADVCVYNARVMGPAHVESVTHLAIRSALARRGVANVTMPVDIQSMKVSEGERSERNVPHHTNVRIAGHALLPSPDELARAAQILRDGRNCVILAGRGAIGARAELEAVADLLGAPIVKALLGKTCVPDDSPFTTGGIGLLGTRPSQEAIEACDTLLMVGTSFPYIEFYPRNAKTVQIDADATRIGLRHRVDAALVGDSVTTLRALIPLLTRKPDRSMLERAQRGMADWWKGIEEQSTQASMPMKPQVVAWELGKRLAQDAIVTCDSGTVTTWFARCIKAQANQLMSLSGTLASMAAGLPYAIGAAAAFPGRQVVAFVGDGAFSMLMADFVTCVKYGFDVKVIILKNNTLGQIKWEQMVFLGNPEYGCELQPIDFALFAKACGGLGISVSRPDEMGLGLDELFAQPGPAVLEAIVDPLEPPMPPSATLDQAAKLAEALVRGEPDAVAIAGKAVRAKIREMV